MSIANRIDVLNLYERIAAAQDRLRAEAMALGASAKPLPLTDLDKLERNVRAAALLDAARVIDQLCFVADVDGCVAPLPCFPRDYPITDTDLNHEDAAWRDAEVRR